MARLVIITPKNGRFAKMLTLLSIYNKIGESATHAYFTYIGEKSPKDKVCDFLSSFHLKEFSLVKKSFYYRLKIYAE